MDFNKADGRLVQKLSEWNAGTRPDEEESDFLWLVADPTDPVRQEIEACGVRIGTFGETSTFRATPLSALNRLLTLDPAFLVHIELSRTMFPRRYGALHPGLLPQYDAPSEESEKGSND